MDYLYSYILALFIFFICSMRNKILTRHNSITLDYLNLCTERLESNMALVEIEMSSATEMAASRDVRVKLIDKIGMLGNINSTMKLIKYNIVTYIRWNFGSLHWCQHNKYV